MDRPDLRGFLPLTHLEYHLLAALGEAPTHGYALVQRIRARSNGLVDPGTGSFYSIIKKLDETGLIVEAHGEASDQRRRYYALTKLGRDVLIAETDRLSAQIWATRRLRPALETRGRRR